MKAQKILDKLLRGSRNIPFEDMLYLLQALGFREVRVSGSHHIFTHPAIQGHVNLQPRAGEAKPYQVRQVLKLIEKYRLRLEDGE